MLSPEFWDVAWKIGLPFVMVCIALVAFYRGDVVTKRAYDEMAREKDRQILREQNQLADLWASAVVPSIQIGRQALDKLEAATKPRATG